MTKPTGAVEATPIRPFHVNVPEADLTELRRRINATRWPEQETVADTSQGVRLATIQKLARYWGTDYDWRKCEAKLKALPHIITEIDGLDIHFIHVRSQHEDALPLIITHGWPGSIIEQLKIKDLIITGESDILLPKFEIQDFKTLHLLLFIPHPYSSPRSLTCKYFSRSEGASAAAVTSRASPPCDSTSRSAASR